MKALWAWIISGLVTAGLATGALFYVIPKYGQHKDTGYVQFVDKILDFVKANWIWLVVILGITLIAGIALAIVARKKH